jgi:hypothetical protein
MARARISSGRSPYYQGSPHRGLLRSVKNFQSFTMICCKPHVASSFVCAPQFFNTPKRLCGHTVLLHPAYMLLRILLVLFSCFLWQHTQVEELDRCSSCEVKLDHKTEVYRTEVLPRKLTVFEIFTIFWCPYFVGDIILQCPVRVTETYFVLLPVIWYSVSPVTMPYLLHFKDALTM